MGKALEILMHYLYYLIFYLSNKCNAMSKFNLKKEQLLYPKIIFKHLPIS